jgi:hypothetical protein
MLTQSDKEKILSEFPNIKLSYEKNIYNKVYNSNIVLAIPEGIKCFAWFTILNNKNVCLIMELTENKKIKDIKIVNACFSNEICYGTILYGTVFYYSYNKFFCIEDIFRFKGEDIESVNWGNKLFLFNDLLNNHIKQVSYNNSFIVFGLPLMTDNINDMLKYIENINYKISFIQFRLFNKINNYLCMKYEIFKKTPIEKQKENIIEKQKENIIEKQKEVIVEKQTKREKNTKSNNVILLVKPDIQNDIYHLYCLNSNLEEEYIGISHIPDYKTSVMMNNLFRKIKENNNLDTLEESDTEEEFENEKDDKFVYLDKSYKMICQYNYKFKKWLPIKLAMNTSTITLKKELI